MKHPSAFRALCEAARANVREITVAEVKQLLEAGHLPLVIDVREENEWRQGHLPQAEHLGRGVIERDIEHRIPDKDTRMILYCGGGNRSVLAAESLQKMGYTQVLSMKGGWRAWGEEALG